MPMKIRLSSGASSWLAVRAEGDPDRAEIASRRHEIPLRQTTRLGARCELPDERHTIAFAEIGVRHRDRAQGWVTTAPRPGPVDWRVARLAQPPGPAAQSQPTGVPHTIVGVFVDEPRDLVADGLREGQHLAGSLRGRKARSSPRSVPVPVPVSDRCRCCGAWKGTAPGGPRAALPKRSACKSAGRSRRRPWCTCASCPCGGGRWSRTVSSQS